jgi:hypothetical protein
LQGGVAQRLSCHRFDGGGLGTLGPDLGRPMNASVYMTDEGLRGIIRDPKSVRSWPALAQSSAKRSLPAERSLTAAGKPVEAAAISPGSR